MVIGRLGRVIAGGGAQRVAVLVAVLAAAAAALALGPVADLAPLEAPVRLRWWAIALGAWAAQVLVVPLRMRREEHAITLTELPLVLGLFFASPAALLAGMVSGTAAGLLVPARQPPLKLLFNVAVTALTTAVALLLFHALVPGTNPPAPPEVPGLLAALAAALTATALSGVAIHAVLGLAGNPQGAGDLARVLAFALPATAAKACLALVGVALAWRDADSAWLLVVPLATLFVAYRAAARERREREQLQRLHDTARVVGEGPDVESAVVRVLEEARTMHGAAVAAVTLVPEEGGDEALRTLVDEHGHRIMEPVRVDLAASPWRDALVNGSALHVVDRDALDALAAHLESDALGEAMLAPITGETRTIGVLAVATARSGQTAYDADSVLAFETLAHHASASLEVGRLEQTLDRLVAAEAKLRHQAFHDALTGLANRALFADRVAHATERVRRARSQVAVLFLDLDGFKEVNDRHGHEGGDEVLVAVAGRLTGCLREGDTAARLGGDEFAVLLEDLEDPGRGDAVARRILDALARPIALRGGDAEVRASIGLAVATPSLSGEALLRRADLAMYAAKEAGGARVQHFRTDMHVRARRRNELAEELRHAAARGELSLRFQPLVAVAGGEVVAVEALARWEHPRRGLLGPTEFIGLAEETGTIIELGRWVLEEACREAQGWESDAPAAVSVNVSGVQLEHPDFVEDVRAALARTRLPPERLILEITESVLVERDGAAPEALQSLAALGVTLALDDFGTGWSSLASLASLPIRVLKLDRSLLAELDASSSHARLVGGVIRFGRSLGMRVVVEGIERPGQLERLRDLEADLGQGFHLGRPVEARELVGV
jgi:diguanylate cyclase (GGDEF)-like protein